MYSFTYQRPGDLLTVSALLTGDDDAKLLAGGQTLIPTLKQRLAQPSTLVDLAGLPSLREITAEGEGVRIGAMATHASVHESALVRAVNPALADLAGGIGDVQVRNRGTLGGSVANNDPAADYPGALLALGAIVRTDRREIAADDFFTGLFETALAPGEIITSVYFPRALRAKYAKFPNPASRYAMVGVCVAVTGAGVRVAVTGAGACAFRWLEAERALNDDFQPDALKDITLDPADLNGDMHASAEYRAHLAGVMARRAVAGC